MKTSFNLILLAFALALLGCNYQKQNNQKEKEQTISKSGELVFGDKKLTYFIEGAGFPCFVCADGIFLSNSLSENLKKNFQFIFTENRISSYYEEPKDYSGITMDTIIDDIEILRKKLGYDKVYVLGHSIVGLMAFEYAVKYPQNTLGVIMVNTPPIMREGYMKIVYDNWEMNASEERRMIYKMNNERLNKMNLDSIPETERAILQMKANVPMYWRDSLFDVTSLARNYRENTEGWNYFLLTYLRHQDYKITKSEIKVPVFLSLGSYDFITPQWLWDDYIDKLPTLTVNHFRESGHYPHVEEQELFDKQLLKWIKDN